MLCSCSRIEAVMTALEKDENFRERPSLFFMKIEN